MECFTEDGDLVLSDEANVLDSARAAVPSICQLTPVFQKKSKHMIDMLTNSAATTANANARAKSMSLMKHDSRLLLSGEQSSSSVM